MALESARPLIYPKPLALLHPAAAALIQELVRLPVAPLSSNPEGVPGFALLLNSYTDRMDETMTQWYKAIVSQVGSTAACVSFPTTCTGGKRAGCRYCCAYRSRTGVR